MRFITAVRKENPELVPELSRAFWCRLWGRDEPIFTAEDVLSVGLLLFRDSQVANEAGLPDPRITLELASTPEIKGELHQLTAEASDAGVLFSCLKHALFQAFGVPWIVVRKTEDAPPVAFFGSDRLHHVAQHLELPFLGPLAELSVYDDKWVNRRARL